jgi:hypothetical protein
MCSSSGPLPAPSEARCHLGFGVSKLGWLPILPQIVLFSVAASRSINWNGFGPRSLRSMAGD